MSTERELLDLCRGGTSDRQAALPESLRRVHQDVLRCFLDQGRAPAPADLRSMAAAAGVDAADALRRLAEADLVHVGPAGEVTTAYPFSGRPRGHAVALEDGPSVQACCAIDALGIPQLAERDGVITAADPADGTPIVVEVRDGAWTWRPWTTVVLVGSTGSAGPATQCACPLITFHTSRERAERYRQEHARHGTVLDQPAAVAVAYELFGRLLG